jgi:hypothetical protein
VKDSVAPGHVFTGIVEKIEPPDRRFWVMPYMYGQAEPPVGGPVFSIMYAARVFFGRSPSWLRAQEYRDERHPEGRLLLDGKPISPGRDQRGARMYRLCDIEPVAWSLYEQGVIGADRLRLCTEVVKGVARLHGMLEDGQ